MILVDTANWIDHLHLGDAILAQLLERRLVLTHPFVIGEVAVGSLRRRSAVLIELRSLPMTMVAEDEEVLLFIDRHALFGRGLGYVDAHLLASVRLTPDAQIWTRDQRLHTVAEELGLAAPALRQ
ncbi:MAG TPA: PIN domain-containing protein [Kiloniellales bacterium]|nr:PIN domain-containing protein [Kiloniellales bacterium]